MRFYVKLVLLAVVFVTLSWLSGTTGRTFAKEWYFAARCQIAVTLADENLEQRLLDEAREDLRRAACAQSTCGNVDMVAVALERDDYLGR